jgi:diadenosine tetraphosphatase ApaH/serine/threonine PP2A family protein phosphatase
MRVAILTDIHGNREALQACLAHARLLKADRLLFLGDYVGYGADPDWVVETVMAEVAHGAVALLGNHDAAIDGSDEDMNWLARTAIAWTRTRLSAEHRAFLAARPLTHEEEELLAVHANGYAPAAWDYITSAFEAAYNFARTTARITICGHVHVPAIYHLDSTERIGGFTPTPGIDIPLLQRRRWLAVIGAVGQPRDGNPAACYAIHDEAAGTLRYLRVAYDCEAAARKIIAAGLPLPLAQRLLVGR